MAKKKQIKINPYRNAGLSIDMKTKDIVKAWAIGEKRTASAMARILLEEAIEAREAKNKKAVNQ
jgi:hypothetical protein